MTPLKFAAVLLALAVAMPCNADPVTGWRSYTAEASARFGVPIEWIERVIRAESEGQTMLNGRRIRSRLGAMGLMQLMPRTWEMLRRSLALGPDPDDPHDNILAGTLYLRMMYERFGYPGMFAAYNAGPGRFERHLATGHVLPPETVIYLRKVAGAQRPPAAAARTKALFVTRLQPIPGAANPSGASLFAVRNDAL